MNKFVRKTQSLDAAGQTPGRLASRVSRLLIGKHRVDYQPNLDQGDAIEIINAGQMVFSGEKLRQKNYYHYTGYPKGLRVLPLKTLWAKDPAEVLRRAVSRMLPKNRLRAARLKRLRISK